MGCLELWWWYSKPASVEDKEQEDVPLNAAVLFVGFQGGSHATSLLPGTHGKHRGIFGQYSIEYVARMFVHV
jgi:hypothetical protein